MKYSNKLYKFALIAALAIIITACGENNTGNVTSSNNKENKTGSMLDNKGNFHIDNSITRIESRLNKSNSIQVDAEFTFFATWDAFNVLCSNIPKEDFEEANINYSDGLPMDPPLNSSTDNAIFAAGSIEPGLEITTGSNGSSSLAIIGENYANVMGNPSKAVFANFGDGLVIKFSASDVYYVGMDLFSVWSSENLTVEIYGSDGLIGTTTAFGDNVGSFWGVSSNIPITEIRLFSENGPFEGVDNIAFGNCIVDVSIDIKPGSNPNSINCQNSNGNIAVAILSTAAFDALTVDHSTVRFEGASESHVKKNGEFTRHEEDVNGDGLTDLVLHFRFGSTNLNCESTAGTLTGQTFSGQQIRGSDQVRMVNQ